MPLRLKGNAPSAGQPDRRYYMIDVQEGNRRVRISSGTRVKHTAERREQDVLDALRINPDITQAELQAIVRGVARASQPALLRNAARSLKAACDEALDDPKGWGRVSSRDTYATNCRMLQEKLGADTATSAITQDVVDKLVLSLEKENAKATVNRKLFALLAVLRREKKLGLLPGEVPEHRNLDETDGIRTFVMTDGQEQEMLDAILTLDVIQPGPQGGHPRRRDAAEYHDLFCFLADIGCRLSQAFKVRWSDVVEEGGHLMVRFWRAQEQKGGKPRTTPCAERTAAILRRLRSRGGTGPFAGLTKRRAQHVWSAAKKRTSLDAEPEAVIHSLRHTCATRLLQATGDIKLVQDWLGHSALKTTEQVYAKVMTDTKVAALDALRTLRATSVSSGAGIPQQGFLQDKNAPDTGTVARQPRVTH